MTSEDVHIVVYEAEEIGGTREDIIFNAIKLLRRLYPFAPRQSTRNSSSRIAALLVLSVGGTWSSQ